MDEEIFARAAEFAGELFKKDSGGHDIYHTLRVHSMALRILRSEGGDEFAVRMAALLHDADDWKLFGNNGFANARRFMDSENIPGDVQDRICGIISGVSFKGTDSQVPDSLEGKIVQDADRLDAIGAIGIGRAFAYGGSRGRAMHIPEEIPNTEMDWESYRRSEGTTISHFHEKLLKLRDMMNTETAREIAEGRHRYMEEFLKEFGDEWNGVR